MLEKKYILSIVIPLSLLASLNAEKIISRVRGEGRTIHASGIKIKDNKGEYVIPIFEGKGTLVDKAQLDIEEPNDKDNQLYNMRVPFVKGQANSKLQSFFDFYEKSLLRKIRRIWIDKGAYGITEIEFEYEGRIGCLGLQTMGIEVYPRKKMKSYREIRLYEKEIIIANNLVKRFLYDIYMNTECRKD